MNTLNIPPQGIIPFTGITGTGKSSQQTIAGLLPEGKSFNDVLTETLAAKNLNITFTAHARNRLENRQVAMNPETLQRLDQAINIAKEKGGHDSLILLDGDAYLVNVDKRTVITALNNLDSKGGVFTQIDSTVIM